MTILVIVSFVAVRFNNTPPGSYVTRNGVVHHGGYDGDDVTIINHNYGNRWGTMRAWRSLPETNQKSEVESNQKLRWRESFGGGHSTRGRSGGGSSGGGAAWRWRQIGGGGRSGGRR